MPWMTGTAKCWNAYKILCRSLQLTPLPMSEDVFAKLMADGKMPDSGLACVINWRRSSRVRKACQSTCRCASKTHR